MPDIDVDFCMNRRGEVIQYVTEKYGREQVAQIITFNTLGARAAIKDVGRALEMPFADVERLTKLVPNVLNISLADAIKAGARLRRRRAKKDPRVDDVLKVALRLEGLARNCSVHAAGVVISPQPLKELVPLYKTNRDEIVTQFDMSGLEKLQPAQDGLPGADHAHPDRRRAAADREAPRRRAWCRRICRSTTRPPTTSSPRASPAACSSSNRQGMRDILRRYQPSRMEDLTALNALYRPGPIQGGMVDDFIERKWGRRAVAVRPAGVEGAARRDLRRDRLPGTGDADLQPPGRLFAGRRRHAAPRHGEEEAEEMAKQRERFIKGALATRLPAEEDREDFRPDGAVRRLRLQQIALRGVCVPGLRHGVFESALPGGLHGRAAHFGNRQHRQGGEVHQRMPRDGHHHAAAGCERQRLELHARRRRPSASAWAR